MASTGRQRRCEDQRRPASSCRCKSDRQLRARGQRRNRALRSAGGSRRRRGGRRDLSDPRRPVRRRHVLYRCGASMLRARRERTPARPGRSFPRSSGARASRFRQPASAAHSSRAPLHAAALDAFLRGAEEVGGGGLFACDQPGQAAGAGSPATADLGSTPVLRRRPSRSTRGSELVPAPAQGPLTR